MNLDFGPKHDHRSSQKKGYIHIAIGNKQRDFVGWYKKPCSSEFPWQGPFGHFVCLLWPHPLKQNHSLRKISCPPEVNLYMLGEDLEKLWQFGKEKQRFVESKWGPTWFSASTGVCHNHWRNPAIPINFDVTRWFMVDSEYPCFPSLPVLCEIEQDFGLKWCPSQQKSKQPALVTGADTEWLVISSNPSEKYAQDVKNGNLPPIK